MKERLAGVGGGGVFIPRNSWWGYVFRFSKSWPYFTQKHWYFPHPFSDLVYVEMNNLVPRAFPLKNGWWPHQEPIKWSLPPSPIQALGVNPFPSRFIIRTVPRGDFALRQGEEPIITTKWQCYCTSSNSRKFGADRPNKIIWWAPGPTHFLREKPWGRGWEMKLSFLVLSL